MYVKSTVNVSDEFARVTREVNEDARRRVTLAALVGGAVAGAIAGQRGIDVRVLPTQGTVDGWESAFQAEHRAALFQDLGTLGSRVKPLKQPPRTNRTRAPGTGIEPLNFMAAGHAAGKRELRRGG